MACEHILIFLLDHILALRQKKTNIIDFKKNTHMVYNSKSQDKVAQKIIPYLYRFLGFMHTPV